MCNIKKILFCWRLHGKNGKNDTLSETVRSERYTHLENFFPSWDTDTQIVLGEFSNLFQISCPMSICLHKAENYSFSRQRASKIWISGTHQNGLILLLFDNYYSTFVEELHHGWRKFWNLAFWNAPDWFNFTTFWQSLLQFGWRTSPWLKKILKFDFLKCSRLAQFYYFLPIVDPLRDLKHC